MREVFRNISRKTHHEFRFRGEEPGRLENFSDAVFALAITLLLISTSPPTNFEQIKLFVWELIPFACCITIIMLIWYQHFVFFLRYGLRNKSVLVINTFFLVIILFYVYPLKYLARGILIPISMAFGQDELLQGLMTQYHTASGVASLMIIYGCGASTVFLILSFMYRYAWKKSEDLGLNALERFDTYTSMLTNLLLASVPIVSVTLAIVLRHNRWVGFASGFAYFLYPVVMGIYGRWVDRRRRALVTGVSTH